MRLEHGCKCVGLYTEKGLRANGREDSQQSVGAVQNSVRLRVSQNEVEGVAVGREGFVRHYLLHHLPH